MVTLQLVGAPLHLLVKYIGLRYRYSFGYLLSIGSNTKNKQKQKLLFHRSSFLKACSRFSEQSD